MHNNLSKHKNLISISEAAKYLGVSIDTVRRWDKSGVLSSERPDGKNRFFALDDLEKVKSEKPLSISEASEQLGISTTTLRRLEKKGLISPERKSSGERTYSYSEIQRFSNSDYFIKKNAIVVSEESENSDASEISEKSEKSDIVEPKLEVLDPQNTQNKRYLSWLTGLVSENREYISGLVTFKRAFYLSALFLATTFAITVFAITLSFLFYPDKTAEFLGYKVKVKSLSLNKGNSQVLGAKFEPNQKAQPQVLGEALKPASKVSLEIVKRVDPKIYAKIVDKKHFEDVNDLFTVDSEGNVEALYSLSFPDTSYLQIPDSNLVQKLNAEFVDGKKPGTKTGDLAIIGQGNTIEGLVINSVSTDSITSESILDGTILGLDIADESITSAKLKNGTIEGEDIKDGVITSGKISDSTITSSDLKDGVVIGSKIDSDVVDSSKLSSTLTFANADFVDLKSITHASTALMGLRLPNATSATPSSPVSGEGFLAYDTSGDQVIFYNGTTWGAVGSGDITSVTAGNGLSGGATSGDATLTVNLTTSGTTGSSSSNSGLEVSSSGLTLLKNCTNNQILKWNNSTDVWACADDTGGAGGGISTVRESDSSPSVGSLTTLEFGPGTTSSDDFVVTDQTGGVARVELGSKVAHINAAETVTGGWTFNTAATTFTTAIDVNAASTIAGLTVDGSGNFSVSDGLFTTSKTTTGADTAATVTLTNNATTAVSQYGLKVLSASSATATNGVDALLLIDNADNLAASAAIQITQTGAVDYTNLLDSPTLDITGSGAITGATAITSSGTITFSGLTADRGVFTTTGGALTNTAASLALVNSISDETGSGALVFANTPTLTTPVLGAATGTSLTLATGGALQTSTSDTNTLLLRAYDVDGGSYTTFGTLTAGNTPTFDLASGVTIGSSAIISASNIASNATTGVTAGAGLITGGTVGVVTLDVGAGNGITVNANDIALASTTAGAGLTYTTGVLAIGAGTGITVNADSIEATLGTAIDTSEITDNTITLSDIAASLTLDSTLTFVSDSAVNDFKLVFDNSSTGDVATLLQVTTSGTGATVATALDLADADIVTALALGLNDVTVGGATIGSGEFALLDGRSGTLIDTANIASNATTGVTAGAGLTGGGTVGVLTLTIGASSTITVNADDIAVTSNSIGDTQLAFDTGQALTTSSTPTFSSLTLSGASPLTLSHGTPNLTLATVGVNGVLTIKDAEAVPNTLLTFTDAGTAGNLSVTGTLSATGAVSGSNLSGTNTGDQTITLTGDVTGSGVGSFATTIAANSVALGTDTTNDYVAAITAGTGLSSTGATTGENISHSISIDQSASLTWTGNSVFTPSSTNDLTVNTDADSNLALVFSSGTNSTSSFTHSVTNSASSGTIGVNGQSVTLVGTANATGANTITGIKFENVTPATNNTFNGITFGTGLNNFLTSATINISAAGAITGATAITSSGTITFSGLTADRGVFTTTGGALTNTAASLALVNSISDETGSGALVFANTPTLTTPNIGAATGTSLTGTSTLTIASTTTSALTLDSGTTGAVNLGTGNNAKTISIGTGTAGNTINIVTDNTTKDTLNIGSALDDVAITSDSWSITNAGALTVASCTGCGGGGGSLDAAYTIGNTIGTDSGSNVIINLADVVTPTEFTVNNLDTAATNAVQIDNNIASGTLTNGLLIENSNAGGTITNAIQIAETTGTITDGILITGTLANILNSASIDITGGGAITGATGVTSATGDITATAGNVAITAGALTLGGTTRISNTGVGTFITGTAIGSQTFTTNNITDSGALTITSTTSALTLDSGSGSIALSSDSLTGVGTNITANAGLTIATGSTGALTIQSANQTGGSTASTNVVITSGNASGATSTAGNVTLDVGTSTTSNGSILIGTGARAQTITIGNSTGGTITIGQTSGSDLVLNDAQWTVSGAGAAAFASVSEGGTGLSAKYAPIGSDYITVAANATLTGETAIGSLATAISTTSTLNVDSTATIGGLTVDTNGDLTVSNGLVSVTKTAAAAGNIGAISGTSANAISGLSVALTSTADTAVDAYKGIDITWTESTDADTITALNIGNTTTTNSVTTAISIGTGWDTGISVGSGGISTTTLAASAAIAANGGITFDAATDTLGAFTAAGTIDLNTNILTNIGNTGTDFVASTGALTLAGILTANGGVTIAGGQNLTLSSGVGTYTQTNAQTTDATADAISLTLSAGGTGETGALRGLVISQSDTATTGVFDSLVYIGNLKTPETTTNGLFIEMNAASGTLTNAIKITQTAGTITNAIDANGTLISLAELQILDGKVDLASSADVTGVLPIANGGSNKGLTLAAGAVLWTDGDSFEVTAAGNSGECLKSAGTTSPTWGACGGGSSAWSGLTTPTANLALTHAEYTTAFTWDTAASSAVFDGFTLGITNDATTDGGNQRLLVLNNNDSAGTTGVTDAFLILDNKDTDEAVTTAIQILASSTGTITTAIDISDAEIGTALTFGANDISATNFNITGSSGSTVIGSGGNTFTFNPASGPTYAGTARPAVKLILSAEYPGAVLFADGSANSGAMTSDYTNSESNANGNRTTYYEWNSSLSSLQDYTTVVRFTLPSDFSAWATASALVFDFATETTTNTDNKVDFSVYLETVAAADATSLTNVSSVAANWTTATIDDSDLSDCDAAGETCIVEIKTYSKSDNYARIGDITLNYLAKF